MKKQKADCPKRIVIYGDVQYDIYYLLQFAIVNKESKTKFRKVNEKEKSTEN